MLLKDNLSYKNGYKETRESILGGKGGGKVKEWSGPVLKHFWLFPELKLKVRKGIMLMICLSVSPAFKLN